MAIITRLTDFGLPQHILPGASALCAPTPVGYTNRCKVVLFADFRKSPHQILVSPEHSPPYKRHGRASPADINTLHNVNVVEELLQPTVGSDAEIIAKLHSSEDLTAAASMLNRVNQLVFMAATFSNITAVLF